MTQHLVIALVAAGSALAGTIIGGMLNRWSVGYAQRQQDRRGKRQRVHASSRRVLMAAKTVAGMTAPL